MRSADNHLVLECSRLRAKITRKLFVESDIADITKVMLDADLPGASAGLVKSAWLLWWCFLDSGYPLSYAKTVTDEMNKEFLSHVPPTTSSLGNKNRKSKPLRNCRIKEVLSVEPGDLVLLKESVAFSSDEWMNFVSSGKSTVYDKPPENSHMSIESGTYLMYLGETLPCKIEKVSSSKWLVGDKVLYGRFDGKNHDIKRRFERTN